MRVPITVVAAVLAILGPPRTASPLADPRRDALVSELSSRALALEGDPSPGAAARREAVARTLRLLAGDAVSAVEHLRLVRVAERILGRAFGEDPVLEALLGLHLDGLDGGLAEERDDLARYLFGLPVSPGSDAGRAALERADALRDSLDPGSGLAGRSLRLARMARALGEGWRASGGEGGRLRMEINGGEFVSYWFEATAVPSGPEGTWRLEITAIRGRTTAHYFRIAIALEGVTGAGAYSLRRPGEAVFRDFSEGAATGEEYTTRGGSFSGGSLVLTAFDPPGRVIEGTFGVEVSRYVDHVYSWFRLGGEFRGLLR